METSNAIDDVFTEPAAGGFSRQAVPRALIEEILDVAKRAPSGVNTQPWNVFVLQGNSLAALAQAASGTVQAVLEGSPAQTLFREQLSRQPGTGHWPLQSPQHHGDAFLAAVFAAAETRPAEAQADLSRYFRFFDAPVGLVFTISRNLGLGAVLDYGMFLQNITLAARARGVRTCVQTGWKGLADLVLPRIGAPDDALVVCGMAIGYGDADQAPVAPPFAVPSAESFTTWHT